MATTPPLWMTMCAHFLVILTEEKIFIWGLKRLRNGKLTVLHCSSQNILINLSIIPEI